MAFKNARKTFFLAEVKNPDKMANYVVLSAFPIAYSRNNELFFSSNFFLRWDNKFEKYQVRNMYRVKKSIQFKKYQIKKVPTQKKC